MYYSLKANDEQVCSTETNGTVLIPPHAVMPNAYRAGSRGKRTGLGVHKDSSKCQIVHLPVEPALSALGETTREQGSAWYR